MKLQVGHWGKSVCLNGTRPGKIHAAFHRGGMQGDRGMEIAAIFDVSSDLIAWMMFLAVSPQDEAFPDTWLVTCRIPMLQLYDQSLRLGLGIFPNKTASHQALAAGSRYSRVTWPRLRCMPPNRRWYSCACASTRERAGSEFNQASRSLGLLRLVR